jgi:hypothetical protein
VLAVLPDDQVHGLGEFLAGLIARREMPAGFRLRKLFTYGENVLHLGGILVIGNARPFSRHGFRSLLRSRIRWTKASGSFGLSTSGRPVFDSATNCIFANMGRRPLWPISCGADTSFLLPT